MSAVDPLVYTTRWRVRSYEIDQNGHVNNAVYLSYAEAVTVEHAELSGYGRAWAEAHGGGWVVRRSQVEYLRPALLGDELELTVRVELVRGVRGLRRTLIKRLPDREPVAEVLTEWVWVRTGDGRPARVPEELVEVAAGVTAATLRQQGRPGGRRASSRPVAKAAPGRAAGVPEVGEGS
ncbi:MAG TPA: acyl-CoA thioesterase [Candidatus Dormibacteraeota bacterium]|nr:acyl-CoA thioesterase [Candidatus Dormibacteraeota bacterium]